MAPSTRRGLLACAGALLYFLAFPPAGLGGLGFVALVPLHFAVRGATPRVAALVGFGFGVLTTVLTFSWLLHVEVFRVHHLAIFAAYLALYPAILCAAWSKVADRAEALLLLPVAAAALDWLRGHAGLASVPWLTIAETQHANPWLLQLASVGGEPLVTMVVVAANVAIAQAAAKATRRGAMIALGAVALCHVLGGAMVQGGHGRTFAVAVVQPNFDPRKGRQDAFERLEKLTREAAREHTQLIVWPESAAGDTENDTLALFQVRAAVERSGVPIAFGSSSASRDGAGHNAMFLMKPGEPMAPPYRKVRLVPFAETRPPLVPQGVGPVMFETIAGARRTTFDLDGVRIEPVICFESLFADDVRETASSAPSVIVVAANDSWFGLSAGPMLHNLVGAFRAVENRRPVVIASNGGPSEIFDANGRVVGRARPFEQATLAATVRIDAPAGLYRTLGDRAGLAIGSALIILGLLVRRRSGAGPMAG